MKSSITKKLFLAFTGLLAAFFIAGAVINALFLEDYYIHKNEKLLAIKSAEILDTMSADRAAIEDLIGDIDRNEAISVTITDANKRITDTSYPQKNNPDSDKLPKEVSDLISISGDILTTSPIYTTIEAENGKSPRLVYIAANKKGELVILTRQLKGVRDSAAIAGEFYLYIGLVITLIGGIIIYLFSRRMVRPVLVMNTLAGRIASLDFNGTYRADTHDEISELGNSINIISSKLKTTIDSLNKDIDYQKELARSTTHELKTPIGVIKGYAEGLKYGVAEDPDAIRDYCNVIAAECDRMDQLVREFLELSSLEAKGASPQMTEFEVPTLVTAVLERLNPVLSENGMTVTTDLDDTPPLRADFTLLERALGNIVLNAIRYNDAHQRIKISARSVQNNVELIVFNTGPGVPPEALEKIWDAFYKVDKARSRTDGGHGLGLSIVKSIITLHKGSVTARNVDGGIEFVITLK